MFHLSYVVPDLTGTCCCCCQVSPDVGLVQSSTVSDQIPFKFDNGQDSMVSGSYLEFAQRAVLPQFRHLQVRQHTSLSNLCVYLYGVGAALCYKSVKCVVLAAYILHKLSCCPW